MNCGQVAAPPSRTAEEWKRLSDIQREVEATAWRFQPIIGRRTNSFRLGETRLDVPEIGDVVAFLDATAGSVVLGTREVSKRVPMLAS